MKFMPFTGVSFFLQWRGVWFNSLVEGVEGSGLNVKRINDAVEMVIIPHEFPKNQNRCSQKDLQTASAQSIKPLQGTQKTPSVNRKGFEFIIIRKYNFFKSKLGSVS